MDESESVPVDTTRSVRPVVAGPFEESTPSSRRRLARGTLSPPSRSAMSAAGSELSSPEVSAVPTAAQYEETLSVRRVATRRWGPWAMAGVVVAVVALTSVLVLGRGGRPEGAANGTALSANLPIVTALVPDADDADEIEMAAAEIASIDPASRVGVLMIGSKPPCRIVIDGKDTGLVTPQRQVVVAAGRRTITLVNAELGISHSSTVVVTAGRKAKLIRDFTTQLR